MCGLDSQRDLQRSTECSILPSEEESTTNFHFTNPSQSLPNPGRRPAGLWGPILGLDTRPALGIGDGSQFFLAGLVKSAAPQPHAKKGLIHEGWHHGRFFRKKAHTNPSKGVDAGRLTPCPRNLLCHSALTYVDVEPL